MNPRRLLCLAIAVGTASTARAQQSAIPPVRQLGRRLAVSTDTFGNVSGIRQLSDGRVIVNDVATHRLLLFDAALSHGIVIADSSASTKKAYGNSSDGLIAYESDTSFLVDPISMSMLVIDPAGRIVRVIAPPAPSDVGSLIADGAAAFDAKGRLVYRVTNISYSAGGSWEVLAPRSRAPSQAELDALPAFALHDSAAILRADITSRRLDTLGFIGVPLTRAAYAQPVRAYDEWAVVSDGSVALVRALDYHIDWINADGTSSSTPRMAHEWHRLVDSERVAILDTVRQQTEAAFQVIRASQARSDSIARAAGRSIAKAPVLTPRIFAPEDLPDYLPVFTQGAVKADADDNLWIRLGRRAPVAGDAPPIYDIVNRQGRVIDRIQLPPSLAIAGFGPGVVYLTVREGAGTVIATYRIR